MFSAIQIAIESCRIHVRTCIKNPLSGNAVVLSMWAKIIWNRIDSLENGNLQSLWRFLSACTITVKSIANWLLISACPITPRTVLFNKTYIICRCFLKYTAKGW